VDFSDVAAFFDDSGVLDGYTGDSLFSGQMDLYGGAVRDSLTGFRRSVSADLIIESTRGVVSIEDRLFLAGRIISDYFQGGLIRQHLILHPCDGLFEAAPAANFLNSGSLDDFYGAEALLKEDNERAESSQLFNVVNIYSSTTEGVPRDYLLKSSSGIYFRVQNVERTTGGFQALVCSELGSGVLQPAVSYAALGAYDTATDSSSMSDPILIPGFLERYQTNYRYLSGDAAGFESGDKVLTVSTSDVAAPQTGDEATIASVLYQVLGFQEDELGSWELHTRKVAP